MVFRMKVKSAQHQISQPNQTARPGPRPLALHLANAATNWTSSLAALPLAKNGSLPWKKELREEAQALRRALEKQSPEALSAALGAEIRHRMASFVSGIECYHQHPYRRRFSAAFGEPPTWWQDGSSSMLDYGPDLAGQEVPTVLFVPSLINRGYILDLSRQRSLMRYLAAAGIRPLLLEWGAPLGEERQFSLDNYVAGRLNGAIDAALETAGQPIGLAGYCMGGLLAIPPALARPADISSLILMATPWDFRSGRQREIIAVCKPAFEAMISALGVLPVDAIQALFAALDPLLAARKFSHFAGLEPGSAPARNFVALEDWLNDGVDLSAGVARDCLFGWYEENRPAHGRWRIAGQTINPGRLSQPVLNIVPARDRIVPPESAEPLSALIPRAETWRPALGHIGMIASPRAKRTLWRQLANWIKSPGKTA